MTTEGASRNNGGWSRWEEKVLGDLSRLEQNQVRIFQKQEDHSVALATLFSRISMLAAGIAAGVSIALKVLPAVLM